MPAVTDLHLARIMRNASQRRRAECLAPINDSMQANGIETLNRAAAFIAQLAHESGELHFMEEIWGPTSAQKRYEPPGELARRLGNTRPGDGLRYKGRGPIQLTGRFNYRAYGKLLGLDLEGDPAQAARPAAGFAIAGCFWSRNGLNALADAGDFTGITRRINGGLNGAAERNRYHALALQVLAESFPARAAAPAKAARAGRTRAADVLPRGQEAIEALAGAASPPAKKQGPKQKPSEPAQAPASGRILDTRPDTLDFRDLMYTPTLVEVPTHVPLGDYLDFGVPILDQGREGACTGFGLATVANYLLLRRRVLPDAAPVSARMFYHLARRYDEWPGENYSGSSARGAMKGWHKHGVCAESLYPHVLKRGEKHGLNDARAADAARRPLGAYFRVNHKDLVAMHSAIAEVGVLYASCRVHQGWNAVGADGVIAQSDAILGGHAFAIVAYDEVGFWLQNSWGPDWGRGGFGHISYDDWLVNGTDVWVARLGAPAQLRRPESTAAAHAKSSARSNAYAYAELRPHIVSVGNDGQLKAGGDYGSTPEELARVFEEDIPRAVAGWKVPRVLLYAHGGLVSEQTAVQRLAEYRPLLMGGEVYPLAFVWRTDYWTTITNILKDAISRRRPEGALDAAKDFMLDRLDDALEPVARALSGKSAWEQMKQNALAASGKGGAAVRVAEHLKALAQRLPGLEIHLVGHSAGAILLAPVPRLLADRGLAVKTCTLWAPACTVALFRTHYLPALQKKQLRKLALFLLSDQAEQDDHCARIYNKSLLYLVSNAFEEPMRIPFFRDGVPILGMARWLDAGLREVLEEVGADIVVAPNSEPENSPSASGAMRHGDFDDDRRTVVATYRRIAAEGPGAAGGARGAMPAPGALPVFRRSESSMRDQRQQLDWRTLRS